MKFKAICAVIISSFLLTVLSIVPTPTRAAEPADPSDAGESFDLIIPAIDLEVSVIRAKFTGRTWDFSKITETAGYFEGMPLPGEKGNAVIGAHSELDEREPGPFYILNKIAVGDQILITRSGIEYTYIVTEIWTVKPADISPLYQTDEEVLTLLTCSGYSNGLYTTRLAVRAERLTETD